MRRVRLIAGLVRTCALLGRVPFDDHEQRRSVWRSDRPDWMKTGLLVATNCSRVRGIWIGLHLCDGWVLKELAYERGDHSTSHPLS